jgi:excisionase family DNA binding protein
MFLLSENHFILSSQPRTQYPIILSLRQEILCVDKIFSVGYNSTMGKITSDQAAERLGVTRQRISQLVIEGRLPAEYFGRQLMIEEGDLDKIEFKPAGRPRTGALKKTKRSKKS